MSHKRLAIRAKNPTPMDTPKVPNDIVYRLFLSVSVLLQDGDEFRMSLSLNDLRQTKFTPLPIDSPFLEVCKTSTPGSNPGGASLAASP